MASGPETSDMVWPLRTWTLALLGGLIALAIQQLVDLPDQDWAWGRRLVAGLTLLLGIGGLVFGLFWQRGRLMAAILVALLCGIVAGGVFIWNTMPWDNFGTDGWHLFSGLIAAGAMLVLAQAAQDDWTGRPARWTVSGVSTWRRESIHYAEVHGHIWTNALLLILSGAFMLLCMGIAYLMAEMFWLVKLDFLRVLLRKDWFSALIMGVPLGAALGLLRDRRGIITALQRVAMLVLRVLAPVVAIAIFIFLAALPFTGLAPLWDTGGTTPIMLVGAALALFLCNAVVADRIEDESRSTILSASAAALGLFLLPMVGIAVFSSGLRIQQYGLSPDRLWALTFVIMASIVAIAYGVTVLGRRGWFARVRRANLHLVYLIAAIALLLSTPLLSFDRLATAHQIARLAGGQVSAEAFDYKALWFDFGPPGKAAIERLAAGSSDPLIKRYAAAVKKLDSHWDDAPDAGATQSGIALEGRLTILPRAVPLDDALRARLIKYDACGNDVRSSCIVHYVQGQDYMVVYTGPTPTCDQCKGQIRVIRQDGKGGWSNDSAYIGNDGDSDTQLAAIKAGNVEIRTVQRQQLFIGGKPVGEVIPIENAAAP